MNEKTARKYKSGRTLSSQVKVPHLWKTRKDPFEDSWEEMKGFLELNSGLDAKTLFEYLQRNNLGNFSEGQVRTLQRKVKVWRATEGPSREVYHENTLITAAKTTLSIFIFGGEEDPT